MNDPFVRFTLLVVRWRWIIVAIWTVLLVIAGGVLAPKASGVVKGGGFSVPGSESVRAAGLLERDFGISPGNTAVIAFRSTDETVSNSRYKHEVVGAVNRVKRLHGVASVLDYFNSGDTTLVSSDRHVTVAAVSILGTESQAQKLIPKIRTQLKGLSIEHYVTAKPAIDADTFAASESDVKRSELITIPVILILLLVVFRTVVASTLPIVLGACSVLLSQAIIFVIASRIDTSIFALNVSSMIGLGLGIDFSLMIVSRMRAEVDAGRDTLDALTTAMATAGRSITYSGSTVVLAMLILTAIVLQLMIVRSLSLAIILVAITSLAAALTLLPALLSLLGPRLEWLPVLPRRKRAQEESGLWYGLSRTIMRRPWLWLCVSLIFMGALAFPARELKMAAATPGSLPPSAESVKGYNVVKTAFTEGSLAPIQVVMSTHTRGVWTPSFLAALRELTKRATADPRVLRVQSLVTVARAAGITGSQFTSLTPAALRANSGLSVAASRLVNLHSGSDSALVEVTSKYGEYDDRHQQLVADLRSSIIPGIPGLSRYRVLVSGEAATFIDFQAQLYGRFPYIVLAIMTMVFIILMMFFQSVFLPIKAILLNLITVLATYGVLVLIFQHGFATPLLGFTAQGVLSNITPAILFVILFALSTDYEVFMLSRVKEYYHQLHDNDEAVARGLQNTAGLVTAAGLILVGTFGSFASASVVTIKEIGLGLAIGVALDTTIVRVIMVPSSMRLMGSWNWWMPAWLKKVVPEIREGPAPAPALVPAMAVAGSVSEAAAYGAPSSGNVDTTQVMERRRPSFGGETMVMPEYVLRPTGGSVGVYNIPVRRGQPLRIGRDSGNELQLYDPFVSRFHARIDYDAGAYSVTDLGSSNGVSVNLVPIPPNQPFQLNPGDTVRIAGVEDLDFAFEQRQ